MLEESDPNIPLSGYMQGLHFQRLCALLMRYHRDDLYLQDIGFGLGESKSRLPGEDRLLAEAHLSAEGLSPTGREVAIVKILQYILNNYATVTLSQTAKHFNYSEAHLCRIIKKYTCKTFADIRTSARIQHAGNLLTHNPAVSIEDISRIVGYADLTAFYKAFKRIYGITPAAYRKGEQDPPPA